MVNIVFDPWVLTPSLASISWVISSDTYPPISRVEYRAWRAADKPAFQVTTATSTTAAVDITNFDGTAYVEVVVTDSLGNKFARISQIAVTNRTRPTAPDWLTCSAFSANSLTLQWGALYVSSTTAEWRVYHRQADGTEVALTTVPVTQRTVTLALPTASLNVLFVRGVDATGAVSPASPVLTFTPNSEGPTVTVAPWAVTLTSAQTTVTVPDPTATVTWTLKRGDSVLASGSSAGSVTVPVVNFQGLLRLTVVAVNPSTLARREVVSEVQVWNVIPQPPTLTVEALAADSIRLRVEQSENDGAAAPYAELEGLGLVLRQAMPLVYTYTGLTPQTAYTFKARAVNAAGYRGPYTEPLTLRTYAVISVAPPLPGALVAGPVLSQMQVWLRGELLAYFLQATADTRVRDPLAPQAARRPPTLYPFLDMVNPIAKDLGKIIRRETADQESYDASLVIDRAGDVVQKLAIWCERLRYGGVVNKAF